MTFDEIKACHKSDIPYARNDPGLPDACWDDRFHFAHQDREWLIEQYEHLFEDNVDLVAQLDAIKRIKSRTFKSLNGIPVGLPENEQWVKKSDILGVLQP